MYFIDSNIIIYANDCKEKEKQERCIDLVSALMRRRQGVISIQVLQEYACTALQKLHQATEAVLRQVKLLESLEVVLPEPQTVIRAVEIQCRCQISFWDASIVAAAEHAKCHAILSEDLNEGQYYAGIPVINPLMKDDFVVELGCSASSSQGQDGNSQPAD